ncbi:hypothetical protein TRSC58_01177 [Trypanosoma rangeli SC58]|uniref:Mucin-associated surface protein (MASP) n=1 Tax=Trypanosoma rangeli SC58 TaxID=429131 RepID=A0A061JCU8_TRYRA|nr:hypothetical protein TRSC58_01177 [Trypanosoma rangeli SC58]
MCVGGAPLWVLLVCWLLLLAVCAAGGKEGGGAACGAMRGTSPASSCDSAEDIYNLLCAVQAQANADEEEVKTRRLCIANYERETERAQEEARDLSEQHTRACEELKGKRLRVEEQRLRHAGAVEHLSRTKQEVAEVVGALFECELPLHSVVEKGTPQEILSPAVLRSATASLKQKIRVAMEQQRRRSTETQRTPSTAAHEANSANEESDDAGHPFTVRFRCESVPAAAPSSFPTDDAATGGELTDEGRNLFSSVRPRRKVVTFNDTQLEVHTEKNSSSSAAATVLPRVLPADLEETAPAYGVLNTRRFPRRTLWQTKPCPQK